MHSYIAGRLSLFGSAGWEFNGISPATLFEWVEDTIKMAKMSNPEENLVKMRVETINCIRHLDEKVQIPPS